MGLRRARRGSPDDSARQQQDAVHRNQELIRLRSAQICEAEHTAARLRAVLQTHQREARAHSAQPLPRERRAAVLETLRELQDTQRRITAKYHECGVLRTYLARLQGVTEQRALMEASIATVRALGSATVREGDHAQHADHLAEAIRSRVEEAADVDRALREVARTAETSGAPAEEDTALLAQAGDALAAPVEPLTLDSSAAAFLRALDTALGGGGDDGAGAAAALVGDRLSNDDAASDSGRTQTSVRRRARAAAVAAAL